MAKLIYTNSRGDSVELGQSAPFFITNIEGLSNVDNIISTIKSPNQDGETETNATLSGRNLVIQGEYQYFDRQEGRNKLIKVFNPKLQGRLRYENSNIIKEINCRPEKTPIISSTTKSTVPFIINLFAADPYWKDLEEIKEEVAIWRGAFEFPLEIPINDGIEFGFREPSLIANIENNGDVPCGMKVEFKALGSVVNPSLFNVNTREYMKINKTMGAGEILTVTTHFQNKRVEMYRNGIISNAFNWWDLHGTFLQLDVGDNLLRYDADEGLDNLEVNIWFTPQYLGV
ncbi:phage tail family protein [Tissierella sp.]|uniref:phage tail family protein n=1 Tax=Tissierella sp. TaxID=41274 RepID=UPI00306BACCD